MKCAEIAFAGQRVSVCYPDCLEREIALWFGDGHDTGQHRDHLIEVVSEAGTTRFSIVCDGSAAVRGLDREDCLLRLLGEIVHALAYDLTAGVAFHAAAVSRHGRAILIPGTTGSGKSCLAAWLVAHGSDYLSDEMTVFGGDKTEIVAFSRPLVIKDATVPGMDVLINRPGHTVSELAGARVVDMGNPSLSSAPAPCRLMVFPHFTPGGKFQLAPLSAAEAALELMANNVNARNLPDHGLGAITVLARDVPAFTLHYGDFGQLDATLDTVVDLLAETHHDAAALRRAMSALTSSAAPSEPATSTIIGRTEPPPPTPRRNGPCKLTIGMATYDDYDGVYFSIQALRMYHPEILDDSEIIAIDNNPLGRCAQPLKDLENSIPNYRYVPAHDRVGTTVRGRIFAEASGDSVLCMDCHVFIVPGAICRLINYLEEHGDAGDLLHGPLVYDDLKTVMTHFEPKWSAGMFGRWASDERGIDPEAPPFDIPMQGMGLFACRRDAWLGFNSQFRGFGGEEGYIHEKFRRSGRRVLCLPFLRWVHRFGRPLGVPYRNTWEDRIWNYLVGFKEVGLDIQPIEDHFSEVLTPEVAGPILKRMKAELHL